MANYNLKDYLNSKECVKIICGAGNKDYSEITKLCALYAAAGCRFFDVSASIEAVRAAKLGFKLAGKENECFLCVSVGTKNDPHLTKCKIRDDICISCGICAEKCMQNAIYKCDKYYSVKENKCIGCRKCMPSCPVNAIENYSEDLSLSDILPPLINEGVECIEYHAISDNEEEVMSGWNVITKLFNGALSVCLDRSKLGNDALVERLKALKNSCNNLFIIQADGATMSGGLDDYRITLQAVAAADIIERADITPYIIMSGGTNSKTMELARLCGVNVSGYAVGSYARKIVKPFIEKDDFLNNKNDFNEALKIAKTLIPATSRRP